MIENKSNPVIEELRASYIKSLEVKVAELKNAVEARRFKDIVRIGHQLKGSGASYGMPEISDLGSRLEAAADDRRISLLQPIVEEFEDKIAKWTVGQTVSEKS